MKQMLFFIVSLTCIYASPILGVEKLHEEEIANAIIAHHAAIPHAKHFYCHFCTVMGSHLPLRVEALIRKMTRKASEEHIKKTGIHLSYSKRNDFFLTAQKNLDCCENSQFGDDEE